MKQLSLFFIFAMTSVLARGQADCETALSIETGYHQMDGYYGQAPPLNCTGYSNGNQSTWYAYTAQANGAVRVSTSLIENTGIDTRVHIYGGSCDDLHCVVGDDDSGTGYLSVAEFMVMEDETYYIVFDSKWSGSSFAFELEEIEVPLIWFTPETVDYTATLRGVVDMDGDFLDDIVGASTSQVSVTYQLPEGGFEHVSHPISADNGPDWSLAAGDLDGNGFNDLVLAGGSGVSIVMANDDGAGYHTEYDTADSIYVFSQRSNMVDIDNDGRLDVFVCHDVQPNVYFMNTEAGFEFIQGGLGDYATGGNYGSVWIDYDNDGDMDLFIAKCQVSNQYAIVNELHRNNGDGTFTEVGEELGMNHGVQTWSSAWGDFDNDGNLDVLIGASSNSEGGHVLMRNNGDGTFTEVTDGSGFDDLPDLSREWVAHDFDNDGYLDVLGGGKIMRNNGDMTFSPITVIFGNGPVGDLNNDGFLDVIDGGTIHFNYGNDNNYLVINPIGTISNTNGIGSRITVYSESFAQIREIRSGDGFRFMSSLNAYFGLGTDAAVDSVKMTWPSGVVDVITDVPINGPLLIVEGSTAVGVADAAPAEAVIFPNPASDVVYIKSPYVLDGSRVELFDLKGRLVRAQSLSGSGISVAGVAPGTYVLRVDVQGGAMEHTVVIQR